MCLSKSQHPHDRLTAKIPYFTENPMRATGSWTYTPRSIKKITFPEVSNNPAPREMQWKICSIMTTNGFKNDGSPPEK